MATKFKSIIKKKNKLPLDIKIDFKKVEKDRLSWCKSFNKTIVVADKDGHTRDNFITHLRDSEKEGVLRNTTIINFGTGQGKSSACLRLAKKYTDEGYVVFFVNPFKRLVDKYVEGFEKHKEHDEKFSFFNYQNLEKKDYDFKNDLDCNAYLMSMNFLFQDPGNEHSEQAKKKQQFLLKLYNRLKKEKKKVVLFIDEFHANITNFDSFYSVNLIKWYGIIEKSFIVSATFTEEALSLTQKIAVLTDYHVKVYESERTKMSAQADLYVNMVGGYYSSGNTDSLNSILDLVKQKKKEGKNINFIVAYKSMVKELFRKGDTELSKALQEEFKDNITIVTGESKSQFATDGHNAGTAFNTGIDINDPNSVLIVLLPPDSKSKGGIFSSGYLSIVQTIGRLRNGGEIFIYGRMPEVFVEGEYLNNFIEKFTSDVRRVKYISQKEQLDTLWRYYLSKKKSSYSYNKVIDEMNEEVKDSKYYLPNSFPTFSEYIIKYGEQYLTTKFEVFGKGYMPFVLWAACNNQFNNATLKDILIIYPDKVICSLDSLYVYHTLEHYFKPKELVRIVALRDSYLDTHITLLNLLKTRIDPTDNKEKKVVVFLDREVVKSNSLQQHVGINRAIHSLIENYKTENQIYFDSAYLYFSKFFRYVTSNQEENRNLNELEQAYMDLFIILENFSEKYSDACNLEQAVLENDIKKTELFSAIHKLITADYFLQNKIFTFFRLEDLNKNKEEVFKYLFKWILGNFTISTYNKRDKIYNISEWKPLIYSKGSFDETNIFSSELEIID